MADQAVRVTDQNSPVRFLAPDNPLLNSPNKITLADFKGWEQERGLYFWSTWDPQYQAVLGLTDPGEPEATGGLVYARDGKGVYIYTGLSFFRELPDGVPGAYRLFVNLLEPDAAILRHAADATLCAPLRHTVRLPLAGCFSLRAMLRADPRRRGE